MTELKDLEGFGTLFMPEHAIDPILPRILRDAFLSWLTEIWAVQELKRVGIKPRRRAMFGGPPGTGKTTLAHHLAARLGMPMLLVGPEKLSSSYKGETARLVGRLFDCLGAIADQVVVFFDEFDSVAAGRMNSGHNPTSEQDHNLAVNTLLARFDRYNGIVIAATNATDRIDPAIWRRFELHIDLPLPGLRERERIIERYIAPYLLTQAELTALAEAFDTGSPALIREFCEGIKRNIVVGPKAKWPMDKASVFARIVSAIQPHPECGKPRLWSQGVDDHAVRALAWPLSRKARQGKPQPSAPVAPQVVPFARSGSNPE